MRFSLRIQMNVGVGEQIPGLTIPPITWALLLCSQLKVSQFFSHTWRNLWFYADEILPRNKQKRHIFDLHKTIFSIWWYLCTLLHTCIYKEILSSKKVSFEGCDYFVLSFLSKLVFSTILQFLFCSIACKIVRQSLGSLQAVVRQSSGSHSVVCRL